METTYDPVETGGIIAAMGIFFFIFFGIFLFIIICQWKIYSKAGKPGWAAIVPIYGTIVLLEIVNKPVWWFLLLFIPLVNVIIAIIVVHRLSLAFGKDVGFTILLLLLPIVGYPMLAFGDAQYTKPAES